MRGRWGWQGVRRRPRVAMGACQLLPPTTSAAAKAAKPADSNLQPIPPNLISFIQFYLPRAHSQDKELELGMTLARLQRETERHQAAEQELQGALEETKARVEQAAQEASEKIASLVKVCV